MGGLCRAAVSAASAVLQFQKNYGESVIKSLFLLNAGASIAVLSLVGALFAKDGQNAEHVAAILFRGARLALISFSIGLVATVGASVMGYFNFNAIFEETGDPVDLLRIERTGSAGEPKWGGRAVIWTTFRMAPFMCLVATLAFLRGSWFMAHAMKSAASALGH